MQRADLAAAAREAGLPEIYVPRSIVRVPSIPLLGTGKIDYVAAAARERVAARASMKPRHWYDAFLGALVVGVVRRRRVLHE